MLYIIICCVRGVKMICYIDYLYKFERERERENMRDREREYERERGGIKMYY